MSHRAIGRSTATQRANLLLVDAVVCRLPASCFAGLDLDKVHSVVVLGYDVNLVVSHSPVALNDVEASLAQPLAGDILTSTTYCPLRCAHYLARLIRNSMFSPGCTSYVSTPFLKIRIGREPISSIESSVTRSIQPSRRPTT